MKVVILCILDLAEIVAFLSELVMLRLVIDEDDFIENGATLPWPKIEDGARSPRVVPFLYTIILRSGSCPASFQLGNAFPSSCHHPRFSKHYISRRKSQSQPCHPRR